MMKKTPAGSIDERGYVYGMNKKGFNGPRSLAELGGNSLDAHSSSIKWFIQGVLIHNIDNGTGMDIQKQIDLWDAQKENHVGEKTTGVSGFGAKPSTKVLSQDTWVKIYSKKSGADYCKSFASWDKIIKEGKYTGMIDVSPMDQGEIEMFKGFLGEQTGTIITFPKTPFLKNEIKKQFYNPQGIKETNQRLDCIFSKFSNTKFTFEDLDEGEQKEMMMYDYFGEDTSEYYAYVENTIDVYINNKGNPVYAKVDGNGYEIYEKGANWRKKPWVDGRRTSKKVGVIEVRSALRKDKNYFDPNGTSLPGASTKLHAYENNFFSELDDQVKADLYYPSILRNDQYIGNLEPLPRMKPSSARANGESCLKNCLIRTEMSYETISSQDNQMDDIIGIQENKNQLNTHQISEALKRHIEDNITETAKITWDYFKKKVGENEKKIEEERKKKQEEQQRRMIQEALQKKKEQEEMEALESEDDSEEESDEEVEVLEEDSDSDDDSEEEDDPGGRGGNIVHLHPQPCPGEYGGNPVNPPQDEDEDEDIDFIPSYELTGDEIISKFAQIIKNIQNEEEKSKVKEYVIKKISEM